MATLIVESACKSFRSPSDERAVPVLGSLSLRVADGEFVSFFGPNGCGKTTFLNAIAGIVALNSGTISINGKPPGDKAIGYIFQDYRNTLLPWARVLDNITYPLRLRGVSKHRRRTQAQSLLQEMDISLPAHAWPRQLSGGQQQLLVIARALICQPDLMLFDEPFSALDLNTRIQMREKLQDIWARSRATTLFVSHELDEALLLADRLVLFSPRPATIVDIIEIPFERPRTQRLLEQDAYFALRRRALRSFREAIAK